MFIKYLYFTGKLKSPSPSISKRNTPSHINNGSKSKRNTPSHINNGSISKRSTPSDVNPKSKRSTPSSPVSIVNMDKGSLNKNHDEEEEILEALHNMKIKLNNGSSHEDSTALPVKVKGLTHASTSPFKKIQKVFLKIIIIIT